MYKELGKTGEKISAVGIGTWQMDRTDNSINVIKEGIRAGTNFVDTAEYYRNEEMVGRAISGETDIFLATKVFPNHFRYDRLIKACENSLSKLKVSQIDLYQLHWPNPRVPISETMRAMEKLMDDGKIRHIGVSNFDLAQLKEAQSSMKKYEIVSSQVEYNPMVRYVEKELLEYCNSEKITTIAYSPLKHGSAISALSGDGNPFAKIAESHKATVPQIILRWLISKEGVVAIPKTSRIQRAAENVSSQNIDLSSSELKDIDEFVRDIKAMSTKSKVGGLISFFSWFS